VVTAPRIDATAENQIILTAPVVNIVGNLVVSGNVSDGTSSMGSMRTTYNTHDHLEANVFNGPTGPPQQNM